MTINVTDKTEKIQLGSTYELRGNFVEQTDEDGNVSYSCDMFRTKDKTKTFDDLYESDLTTELTTFLADSNYISINYSELSDEDKTSFLAEISSTFDMTNESILSLRKLARESLNSDDIISLETLKESI